MLSHYQIIVNTLLLVVVQYVTYDVCHVCHNCSCCNCNGFQQMHRLARVDKPHDILVGDYIQSHLKTCK